MDVHFLIDMIFTLVGLTFFIPAYDLSKDSKFQCGFPGTPKYGMIKPNKDLYEDGEIVTYSCRVGYILLGQSLRKCKNDGTWTEDIPICDDSMTTLGVAFSTPTVPGHPAELAIDRDKETCASLKPRSQKEQRWWTIDLGQDHKVLSVAITIPSTDRNVNFVVYVIKIMGSTAAYKICASFSGKFGTQTLLLSCAEGKGIEGRKVHLTDSFPSDDLLDICEVEIQVEKDEGYDCGKPNRNPHSITHEPDDNVVRYDCMTGYRMEGPDIRTCMGNGQWSGKPPICEAIICDELDDIKNGYIKLSIINGDVPLQGTVAHYHCNEGYRIAHGEDYLRMCLEDGTWDGKKPHCEAIRCPVPDGREHGGFFRLINTTTSMGSMAVLKCRKGKREGDNPYIICTEEGEWTDPDARCLIPATNIKSEEDDDYPRIVNKGAVIFGMVVAGVMVSVVLISMYVVMQRRRNGNKPEVPSRQIESPEAPPRPPPRSKGQSVLDFISRKGDLCDDQTWKTRSLPLNQKGKSEAWPENTISNRASSYDQHLQNEQDETKKSKDTVKDTTDNSATPKKIPGREYAAVDYEKKRQSRLLKNQSSEDTDSDRIKTPSPINEDTIPPTIPPKGLEKKGKSNQPSEDAKPMKSRTRTREEPESKTEPEEQTRTRKTRQEPEPKTEPEEQTRTRKTRQEPESKTEPEEETKTRKTRQAEQEPKLDTGRTRRTRQVEEEPESDTGSTRRTRQEVEEEPKSDTGRTRRTRQVEEEPEPDTGRRTRRTRGRTEES